MSLFGKKTSLRDTANVIADAVETAKDQEIAKVENELAAALQDTKASRVQLKMVIRAGKKLHDAITNTGDDFRASVEGMARDLNRR